MIVDPSGPELPKARREGEASKKNDDEERV